MKLNQKCDLDARLVIGEFYAAQATFGVVTASSQYMTSELVRARVIRMSRLMHHISDTIFGRKRSSPGLAPRFGQRFIFRSKWFGRADSAARCLGTRRKPEVLSGPARGPYVALVWP
jgi:hypothetical protein